MNKKLKRLQIVMLDRHLAGVEISPRPSDGWLRAMRRALGMSTRQLAQRMRITQQSADRLERNELDDSITLKRLRAAAEAIGCQLVYVLVPEAGSIEGTLRVQAMKKARALIDPVNRTMVLESQGVGKLEEKIREKAEEFMQNPNPRLWDE
jgi:predicted DNA-binding mobile mystery protein A